MATFRSSLALASALAPLAASATPRTEPSRLSMTLDFPTPILQGSAQTGLRISMEGFPSTLDPWQPELPFQTLRIALPLGTTAVSARLDDAVTQRYEGNIEEISPMIPIAGMPAGASRPPTAPSERPSVEVTLQHMHGVPVAVIRVIPVEVEKNSFRILERATLVVETRNDGARKNAFPALRAHQEREVARIVDNPDALPAFFQAAAGPDDYETLVITTDALAAYTGENSLQALQQHWRTRGLRSRVVTVNAITAASTGADAQEKIRNFIADQYKKHGVQYVLLAGDGDGRGTGAAIPARRLWAKVMAYDGQWREIESQTPADIYYACLDGTFNGNGNAKWGETNDGPNGGDVDLLPEVTVGRASIESIEDLRNFVRKTVHFAGSPRPRKALLAGEVLFAEKDLYGDDYLKQLVGRTTDHGYETRGYGTDWSIDVLGDRQRQWSGSEALARINQGGYAMVNHLGHSNTWYNMRLNSGTTFPAFQNAEPFFYYTQGCYPGDFTANDSFIEKFLRHRYGIVAAVANTVYGLGPEDPDPRQTQTPGASQMLHRQFVDAVFNEGIPTLGRAHQDSKIDFLGYRSTQEMRWVFWSATYFGDPSLPLRLTGD